MLRLVHVAHRHLVRTPVVLAFLAIDLFRAGPAFRRSKHDHRPRGAPRVAFIASLGPDLPDFCTDRVEHPSQLLVDVRRVASLDEVWLVPHALKELLQFLPGDTSEEARVGDLVPVEVEDGQDAPVAGRVEELVAVPAGRERPCLGFAVAHDAGDDQVRVVEGCAVGMAQCVAEFAAFMNAARCLRRDVAGDAAREAELLEQLPHAFGVLADVRVHLAVCAFKIGVSNHRRTAMTGTNDVDHVEVVAFDHPIEVHVEHVQARRRAPMAEQPRLDVFALQRFLQEGIVEKIDLPD